MGKNKLPKCHRLANRGHIQLLFQKGNICKLYPCSIFYLQVKKELSVCNKVLFAVSKRHIRSAVQRNKVKRLLREAYRIHKYLLDDALGAAQSKFVFLIGYVYTGKGAEIHYPILYKAVIRSLQYLSTLPDEPPA